MLVRHTFSSPDKPLPHFYEILLSCLRETSEAHSTAPAWPTPLLGRWTLGWTSGAVGTTSLGSQPLTLECSCEFWGQWVLTEQQPEQIIPQDLIAWENLSCAGGWSGCASKAWGFFHAVLSLAAWREDKLGCVVAQDHGWHTSQTYPEKLSAFTSWLSLHVSLCLPCLKHSFYFATVSLR